MTADSFKDESSNIEDLVVQLQEQLQTGKIDSVQQFVKLLGMELSNDHLRKLVMAEVDFRNSNGEQVELADYLAKFPTLAIELNPADVTEVNKHESTAVLTEVFTNFPEKPRTRKLVQVGDSIDDFELLAELGKGSFATVFLARQTSMQRLVALKVSADHGMEAQTLAQLDHPNVVRVYDQRPAKKHDLQLLYMQYLEGGTLMDVLNKIMRTREDELSGKTFVKYVDEAIIERGSSPNYDSMTRKYFLESDWNQTICRIGYHLACALEYAHDKGVLHRDIKPANVLIASDCSVKLADFNISSAEAVVGDSKFGGSLAYMPPEQIRAFSFDDEFQAEQLDHRCDIYSLGVLLYQMLKQELPFYAVTKSRSADGLKTMISEREHSIERIVSSLNGQSPLLRNALVRCLQPNLDNRPEDARDLANQLKIALDRESEEFLFPSPAKWISFLQKYYFAVCIVVAFVFNAMGARFIKNFNLKGSVPDDSAGLFNTVVLVTNGIIFPLALVIFVKLTFMVPKALRLSLAGKISEIDGSRLATQRAVLTGHLQAVTCGSLWLIAGFIYPIVLSLLGCDINGSGWRDFIVSHTLAGFAITALTFFVTTYLALKFWLPVLIQHSFTQDVVSTVTSALNTLLKKIPIYQMIAVAVPLLAIALLVIYKDLMTGSENALKVISVFGLFTIPIVLTGGNHIRAICEKLLVVFREK